MAPQSPLEGLLEVPLKVPLKVPLSTIYIPEGCDL